VTGSNAVLGLAAIAGTLLLCGPAAAADEFRDAVSACAAVRDDAARLACYDREVARLGKSPEDLFGSPAARRETAEAEPKLPQIAARIAAISTRGFGEQVFTLDNGQVWAEKNASNMPLKIGDPVTIRSGRLGAFYLSNPRGRQTQVSRIR
jgi:hypothetical protein